MRTPELLQAQPLDSLLVLKDPRSEPPAYPEITKKPPTSTFSCVSSFSIVRFFVPNLALPKKDAKCAHSRDVALQKLCNRAMIADKGPA